jgi:cobalt-zinc-cadmium efflux system outer membrane protein
MVLVFVEVWIVWTAMVREEAVMIILFRNLFRALILFIVAVAVGTQSQAQTPSNADAATFSNEKSRSGAAPRKTMDVSLTTTVDGSSSALARYFDPVQGASSIDIVKLALAHNAELSATRLDIERGRARLRQAGLRSNPTLDFEQSTGRFTGSPGERSTSVGVALPLELAGQRRRRIELAQAALEATEAEVANRERQLTTEVLTAYVEALSALRELQVTEGLNNIDVETARFVQIRVNEGETAPIELNLLRVEVDRLRSRRALVEGHLQAALVKLKNLAGILPNEPLRLKEELSAPAVPQPPDSLAAAIHIALRIRPDLRLARLNEEVARAGLRLVRAQAAPEVTISGKYVFDRSLTDLPEPLVPIPDLSRSLSFGVSLGLPVFNRNQGAKAESATAITQAQRRREFAETVVRADVTSAYQRYEAARSAVATFEQGVINRSNDNIRAIRAAYQIGQFSITDLLVQQRQLLDSQREFTEALAEQYRARGDLQTAMGVPLNPQP